MGADSETPPLNLLQRVDLALARRVATTKLQVQELTRGVGLPAPPRVDPNAWIAGVLGLRGLLICEQDVAAVIAGEELRYEPDHHEYNLIAGMARVYERLLLLAEQCRAPDGWLMVDLFKEFTRDVARFSNNFTRRDMPWDAILYVDHPPCEDIPACLDSFRLENHYTDNSIRFENLHPVRQSFRVMWHFARIAPFSDFNLSMAWVALNFYLLHRGYPMLVAEREDRERLHKLMTGPVPLRVAALESRMLQML